MRFSRRNSRKLRQLVALGMLVCSPAYGVVVNWADASGDWDTPANWSSNPALPGPTDDVTISVTGVPTITHSTGTDTINSLTSNANLALTGGSLIVSTIFSN